jgi:hypothetical protein
MHHLILMREIGRNLSVAGCCGRIEGETVVADGSCYFDERLDRITRVGAIHRAVQEKFGDQIEVTVLDPRNIVSFLPLVIRDAIRYRVPVTTALRAMIGTSVSTAVFDGQILYRAQPPSPAEVVDRIAGRLSVHKVGSAEVPGLRTALR